MTLLSQATGLNAGADLWIVPDLDSSRWAKKIDWYLNFQMCRVREQQPTPLAQEVADFVVDCELNLPQTKPYQGPALLVESSKLLPNRWTIFLNDSKDVMTWAKEIHQLWSSLKYPTLRIFLPAQVDSNEFKSRWSKISDFEDFAVVLD